MTNLPSPSDMEDPSQVDPGKTKGGGGEVFRKPSPSAFYCYGTIIDRAIVKKLDIVGHLHHDLQDPRAS